MSEREPETDDLDEQIPDTEIGEDQEPQPLDEDDLYDEGDDEESDDEEALDVPDGEGDG